MNKINKLIKEIEASLPKQDVVNLKFSKSPVGWHIEHTMLTINLIIDAIQKSDPKDYNWSFNASRLLVFTINKIPRGYAKAPKVVTPKNYDTESLKSHVIKAKEKLELINTFNAHNYFIHPYFGKLNLKQTVKFLAIHTKHHLKIIEDILGSSKSGAENNN